VNRPADVLAAAFAALNLDDWSGFAELCDPVSLRAFKRETLGGYSEDYLLPPVDPDDLMETEPDMPRVAAEYKAAQMNEITSSAHRLKREFLTVKTVEELRELDPTRLFILWIQAHSPYRRAALEEDHEESWEKEADWEPPVDDGKKATRGYRYSVLGSVEDGPDIAHVLYRNDHTPDKIFPDEYPEWLADRPEDEQKLMEQRHHRSYPEFVSCRRQSDGTWRLIADWHFSIVSSLQRVEPLEQRDESQGHPKPG
jgi:hypothetical protein